MSQSDETGIEIRRIRRMLKQMHHLAEHSSLTGALSEGATDALTQYNLILKRLGELGVLSPTLFASLPQDASFDRLGVASKLLEGYLEEEAPAPTSSGGAGHKIIIGNITGMEDLKDLKDLGRVVRENLPDFLRKRSAASTGGSTGSETPRGTPESDAEDADETAHAPQTETPIPMPDLSR